MDKLEKELQYKCSIEGIMQNNDNFLGPSGTKDESQN